MSPALAGLVILVIGDSQIAGAGHFNNALHDGLVGEGATVHTFGVCGSIPSDWITPVPIPCGRGERHNSAPAQLSTDAKLRGWPLYALISRYHPNIVVVALGDTLAGYGVARGLPREWITDEVHQLLLPVRSARASCIWIGPTWGTENGPYQKTFVRVKALSDLLSQIVAPCRYVDSLMFSRPGEWRTIDGVNLTPSSTRLWDADLIQSIDQIAVTLPGH